MPDKPLCVIRIERPCMFAGRALVPGDAIYVDTGDRECSIVYDCPASYTALLNIVRDGSGVIRVPQPSDAALLRAAVSHRRLLAGTPSPLRLLRAEAS